MMLKKVIPLFCLALSQSAYAIVNVGDLHLDEHKPGFSGKLSTTLNSLSGNSNQQEYAAGTSLKWVYQSHSHFLLLDRSYGEGLSVPYLDKSFVHQRNLWHSSTSLAWELFLQAEQNPFARLGSRQLVGGGARFSFMFGSRGKLHLGSGLFSEQETVSASGTTTDAGTTLLNRANLYMVLEYKPSKSVKLVSSTYVQPALTDVSDYRMLEQASLSLKVNESVSLKLNLDIAQDSAPPQTVQPTDTGLKLGLEYNF